jgi:hypothetical protein
MLKLAQALGFENDPAEPAASEVRRVVKRLWPVNAVPGLIGVKGMVAGVGGAVLLGLERGHPHRADGCRTHSDLRSHVRVLQCVAAMGFS